MSEEVIYKLHRYPSGELEEFEQVQELVRCKECKYCLVGVATAQYSNGKQRIENLCEKHKWSVRADDFCSYGEVRDE